MGNEAWKLGANAPPVLSAAEVRFSHDVVTSIGEVPVALIQKSLGPRWSHRVIPSDDEGRSTYSGCLFESKDLTATATFSIGGFRVEIVDRPKPANLWDLLRRATEAAKSAMYPTSPSQINLVYFKTSGAESRHSLLRKRENLSSRRRLTRTSVIERLHRSRTTSPSHGVSDIPGVWEIRFECSLSPESAPMLAPDSIVDEAEGLHEVLLTVFQSGPSRFHSVKRLPLEHLAFKMIVSNWEPSLRDRSEHERPAESVARPSDLLSRLDDWGFSWYVIARLAHVPLHVIHAWRRGESETGPECHRLASLVDLVARLDEVLPDNDVSSWLAAPLAESHFTGIDVLEAGHTDLLLRHARREIAAAHLLDKTFPQWKAMLDDGFEVVTASDGEKVIRLKDQYSAR